MSYTQLGLFTGIYGLLALALSVPAGISAKRFGEKRVLGAGLLGVAAGSVLLGQAWNFRVRAGIPRCDDLRLPVRLRFRAHRCRAHGAAVAAGPHDGGSWRDIGDGVRGRGASGRCVRWRVWLALRDPRLCGHVGVRRRRILVVLPADNERGFKRRRYSMLETPPRGAAHFSLP